MGRWRRTYSREQAQTPLPSIPVYRLDEPPSTPHYHHLLPDPATFTSMTYRDRRSRHTTCCFFPGADDSLCSMMPHCTSWLVTPFVRVHLPSSRTAMNHHLLPSPPAFPTSCISYYAFFCFRGGFKTREPCAPTFHGDVHFCLSRHCLPVAFGQATTDAALPAFLSTKTPFALPPSTSHYQPIPPAATRHHPPIPPPTAAARLSTSPSPWATRLLQTRAVTFRTVSQTIHRGDGRADGSTVWTAA